MLMHKHFSIPVLTTREAVGKTSPSKHETSYGVQYKNLCIVGPDPKYNTDRTCAEESEERLRVHYMYLKSILSTHPDSIIRELKSTKSDVVTWFKEAKVKKWSKKVVTCNVQFPPLSFIHVPFEVLRVQGGARKNSRYHRFFVPPPPRGGTARKKISHPYV